MKPAAARKTFEIRIAYVRIGTATYPRPCIVTEYEPANKARIFLLSTKDYSERGQSFRIDKNHPDFPATGLQATSFTVHPNATVPVEFLKTKYGELTGDLAKEFEEWLG